MRIKSLTLCLLTLFAFALPAKADVTPEQRNFMNKVSSFLRNEGFAPSTSENKINFKKEGNSYWISVMESNPFYVEFHRSGLGTTDADLGAVIAACNHANRTLKCVKAYLGETTVSIAVEVYCQTAQEFNDNFYKNLNVVDRAYEVVKEKYSEYEDYNPYSTGDGNGTGGSTPFTFVSCSVGNQMNDGTVISDFGNTIFDFQTQFLTPQVTFNVQQSGTYEIFIKMYKADGTMASSTSSPAGYTYSHSVSMSYGTNTYNLPGWGSTTSGYWPAGSYRFEFYYNGNLLGSKSFKVI